MISLPLEYQLQVMRLKMYLKDNPEKAADLAIEHYEDFLALSIKHNKLKSELLLELKTSTDNNQPLF